QQSDQPNPNTNNKIVMAKYLKCGFKPKRKIETQAKTKQELSLLLTQKQPKNKPKMSKGYGAGGGI
ncbi:MAG: hypothetical protein QXS10_07615, partial [Candidatus Bathyarchaeia archaeon]